MGEVGVGSVHPRSIAPLSPSRGTSRLVANTELEGIVEGTGVLAVLDSLIQLADRHTNVDEVDVAVGGLPRQRNTISSRNVDAEVIGLSAQLVLQNFREGVTGIGDDFEVFEVVATVLALENSVPHHEGLVTVSQALPRAFGNTKDSLKNILRPKVIRSIGRTRGSLGLTAPTFKLRHSLHPR